LHERAPVLLGDFPGTEAAPRLGHAWREPAVCIYANWLTYLLGQRAERLGLAESQVTAAVHSR
jgi:hypothetical protein